MQVLIIAVLTAPSMLATPPPALGSRLYTNMYFMSFLVDFVKQQADNRSGAHSSVLAEAIMAENESLDLGKPGGKRWLDVLDAVKKQQAPEIVANKASRKLPKALRNPKALTSTIFSIHRA